MAPSDDPSKDPAPGNSGGSEGGSHAGEGNGGGPKPPPWQVPKPELRPELLNQPLPNVTLNAPRADGQFQDEQARVRKRSQRRTVVVALGVTALLAGTLSAVVASNQEPEYAQVCFNEETGERVEDTQCNSSAGRSGALYAWYFYSRGASVPAVGQNRSTAPDFTRTVPPGAKASTGYSTKGGTVSRGGFGGSSKGGSTGG